MKKRVIVLIPAYEPDEKLTAVVKKINESTDYSIVVVNDGSDEDKKHVFDECSKYAAVVVHDTNKGKGRALKTGIEYIKSHFDGEYIIVTADADGQHKPEDIKKVSEFAAEHPGAVIIGSRDFVGDVPARSMIGNTITRYVYRAVTRVKVQDTQSGLRAFDSSLTDYMASIPGERYEYEMNVLLYSAGDKKEILETPIETVYIQNNESTHFNTLRDSYRIYKQIFKYAFGTVFKFGLSSVVSFLVDMLVYYLLLLFTGSLDKNTSLLISNVFARVVSCTVNYVLNKRLVFKNENSVLSTAIKYYLLAAVNMCCNTWILTLFVNSVGISKLWSKFWANAIMFIFNWFAQKLFVFSNKEVRNV